MTNFNLTLAVSITSLCLATCGQQLSQAMVPAVVINTFRLEYPKAISAEWGKADSGYVVEFEAGISKADHKMILNPLGEITYQEEDITEGELPNRVKRTLARRFPGYKLGGPEKIKKDSTVTYRVEVIGMPSEWEIILAEGGKIIEKIPE